MESNTQKCGAAVDQLYLVRHRLDSIRAWDADVSAMVFLCRFPFSHLGFVRDHGKMNGRVEGDNIGPKPW